MTIIDFIATWPIIWKIIGGIILAVWTFEMFLLPFKGNVFFARFKNLCENIERIANLSGATATNTDGIKEISLLFRLMATAKKKDGKESGNNDC